MAKRLLLVAAVALLCGMVAGVVWGRGAGGSIAVLVLVLGAVATVLRRNQKDLVELEHGHVPEPMDRVLGDDDHRLS